VEIYEKRVDFFRIYITFSRKPTKKPRSSYRKHGYNPSKTSFIRHKTPLDKVLGI